MENLLADLRFPPRVGQTLVATLPGARLYLSDSAAGTVFLRFPETLRPEGADGIRRNLVMANMSHREF